MGRLDFDSQDPFPLVDIDSFSQSEIAEHARHVDLFLGYDLLAAEKGAAAELGATGSHEFETWASKGADVFQTPYVEMRSILESLSNERLEQIVDLGAGYGRWAFVLAKHRPEVRFLGYECVGSRVTEAKRVWELNGLTEAEIIEADVTATEIVSRVNTAYFIFDFGSSEHIQTALEKLKDKAKKTGIVVVARGGRSRHLIESGHPWLSEVVPPLHHRRYSIYRSAQRA